jgi:polysaccharide biosynthesis protein PelG
MMAGASLSLRHLVRRDDVSDMLLGYVQAAMITSGPWIMTVAAVAAVSLLGLDHVDPREMAVFRSILIYNFAFSLVLSGPILLVATRILANSLYSGTTSSGRGILISTLALVSGVGALTAVPFYGLASDLAPAVRVAATGNYFVVAGIWVGGVFQVKQRDIQVVTGAFLVGMITAVAASIGLAVKFGMAGLILGFTAGLAVIEFTLIAHVLRSYPAGPLLPVASLGQFRTYWPLAVAGFVTPAAVWGDKWVMWLSPEGRTFGGLMRQYPLYDSAMFLAFLTMVPAIALFTVFVKTEFLDHYRAFYDSIERHDTLAQIRRHHQRIVDSLLAGGRQLLILQVVVSVSVAVLAPAIIELARLHYVQLSIFRLGTLGAGFHVSFIGISILLLYFDLRRPYLWLQLLFAVANLGLTAAFLPLGFAYYGLGYFVASALCFAVSAVTLYRSVNRLPYLAFVANNPSVR